MYAEILVDSDDEDDIQTSQKPHASDDHDEEDARGALHAIIYLPDDENDYH